MVRQFARIAAILALAAGVQADTWQIDKAHSTIGFSVKHMVIATVPGSFTDFDGSVEWDGKDFAAASISVTIQSKSITTNQERRDGHLRSNDFFAADSFPTVTFKGTKIVKGEGDKFQVTGDLTLRGKTLPVTLNGTFGGTVTDQRGNVHAGFSAEGTINRQDFGVSYSATLDNGGLAVGNDVKILLEIELVKPSVTEAPKK
jgi:polyisoprenoid-binding protein YceI